MGSRNRPRPNNNRDNDDDWHSPGASSFASNLVGRPAGMSDSEDDDSDDMCSGTGFNPASSNTTNGHLRQQQQVKVAPAEEMRLACLNEDIQKVIQLLDDGSVSVDEYSQFTGWNSLMTSASRANVTIFRELIQRGADVNFKAPACGAGLTALMTCSLAADRDNQQVADQLLECANLLIEAGANVNDFDNRGMTALMHAVKENKLRLAGRLIEAGADVNKVDEDGRTALEFAAGLGFGRMVRLLLENGADAAIVNESGLTASEIASDQGHTKIRDILYCVETTKWRPGTNPSLMDELVDVVKEKKPAIPASNILERHERSQIEMVLENLNLTEYAKSFEEHKITYLNFLKFSDSDLKDVGIDKVGVRMKILDAIRDIHNREWVDQSVTPIYLKTDITASEVICILNNTQKHMDYITSSVEYLRKKTCTNPEMLERGIEHNRIDEMLQYIEKTLKSINSLEKEVKRFQTVLHKIEKNVEFQLADEVTKVGKRRTIRDKLILWSVGIAIGIGAFGVIVKVQPRLISLNLRRT